MKLIKPSFEILQFDDNQMIEIAGRTCYKSEDKITQDSADKFAQMLRTRGHHAMLEFGSATVRFICDRGVSHEIVRHRLFSFAQESTRYCNYGKVGEVTFIIPCWMNNETIKPDDQFPTMKFPTGTFTKQGSMLFVNGNHLTFNFDISARAAYIENLIEAEQTYLKLLHFGWTPQQARAVLPNSLKTEIVCKANFREWMHFFKMRDDTAAHPQMRELAEPLHEEFRRRNPSIFE